MVNALNKGATDCGELAKILAAVTDELWKRGYTNEELQKIYGGNKMRVYYHVWEGIPEAERKKGAKHRAESIKKLQQELQSDPHDPLSS